MAITFVWPTDTKRVTSGFRTKSRPDHHGVDIADPGARPIYAAADGVVSRSYTSASYGEVIFILHTINGQIWESVYAHLRSGSRGYFAGQKVKQGKQIGLMGNTGHSYGQHLHFEIHRGRWNFSKSNAVDPLKFLEKDLYPSATLRHGDKGEAVEELQEELLSLGYKLPKYGADGDFGDETEAAVKVFQRDAKITVDGIVGPQTFGALEKALAANQTKTLYLPAKADSWRVYALDVEPVKGNEKAFLSPSKFGGLSYEILGNGNEAHTYIIETHDFGKSKIYAHPDTGAVIK